MGRVYCIRDCEDCAFGFDDLFSRRERRLRRGGGDGFVGVDVEYRAFLELGFVYAFSAILEQSFLRPHRVPILLDCITSSKDTHDTHTAAEFMFRWDPYEIRQLTSV